MGEISSSPAIEMHQQHHQQRLGDDIRDDDDDVVIGPSSPIVPRPPRLGWLFLLRPRSALRGIFLLLGIGVLIPWNAFISAKGYFQTRLCDPSKAASFGGGDGDDNDTMESTFALVYNLSSVTSMGMIILGRWLVARLGLHAGEHTEEEEDSSLVSSHDNDSRGISNGSNGEIQEHRTQLSDRGGLNGERRKDDSTTAATTSRDSLSSFVFVVIPLSLFLLVFLAQTWLVLKVHGTSPSSLWFWILLSITLCGICTSTATAGIVAAAGKFKEADAAMNPFLAGQSLGGVVVSVANFIAACSEDPSEYWQQHCSSKDTHSLALTGEEEQSSGCTAYQKIDWGMFFYWFLGALVLAGCLIGFSWIDRLCDMMENEIPLMPRAYASVDSRQQEDSPAAVEPPSERPRRDGLELLDPHHGEHLHHRHGGGLTTTREQNNDNVGGAPELESDLPEVSNTLAVNDTGEVFKLLMGPTSCIFFTFFVTLALFPGWTSELDSTRKCQIHLRLANDLYTPFSFVLFNIGDLTGRLLAGKHSLQSLLSRKLVPYTMLRFLFFPLLFLCPSAVHGTVQIRSDLYSLLVQFAFAVSNGSLLTSAFAHAPTLLPKDDRADKYRGIMSELLSFSVAFGLLSGSLFAFPVSRMA